MTTLAIGNNFSRIDVVLNQCKKNPIKNAECSRRGVGSLVFNSIILSESIQQCVSSWSNKSKLITSNVDQWRSDTMRAQLDPGKEVYVTANEECWCMTKSTAVIVLGLNRNQEKTDMKMMIHARHEIVKDFEKSWYLLHILMYS